MLDWLAADLVENGWKLKRLHRILLLSSTWMQGGEARPETVKADPETGWAQRPARRLEAEAIRDALLQVGDRLDLTMHGPSEANYESGRRSVYLRVKRSELIPPSNT